MSKRDYSAARQKMIERMVAAMIERMVAASFVSMERFLKHRLRLGEALWLYLYKHKQLLDQVIPGLNATAHSPLFHHQFVEGLPIPIFTVI